MNLYKLRAAAGARADAELRRTSAWATKLIADRVGDRIGMWFGAGYPRSGTTLLCHLMAGYLDLPFVRHYRLPVAMPCVIHSHWRPVPPPSRSIYIVRDGRDVMVSRYFYEVRKLESARNPRSRRLRKERFTYLYGESADLTDARLNLAKFIDAEMRRPILTGVNWSTHVQHWLDAQSDRIAVVRYEDLVADAVDTLGPVFEQLTGEQSDREYLRATAQRFDFLHQAKRSQSEFRRAAYMRKGTVGDWRNYFTPEASEIFRAFAGAMLDRLGYDKV